LRYGDSDLAPVPFEYQALNADWPKIRSELLARDLSNPTAGAQVYFLVPKPEGSYRVATRLDPLDALTYTAAVYECASAIEKSRAPAATACSYRLDPVPDGRLFAAGNGWETWTRRSVELAKESSTTYVVTADISDYYSQIGHHRVCNALESAGVGSSRAQSIEKMLGAWSALQSRGLPVGPHASIVLAEACMNDVDQHLSSRGYRHLRYVDDFRIFCRSHAEAIRAIHDLCDYLFTAHRLSLQPQKTRTYAASTFISMVVERPELLEQTRKAEHIKELVDLFQAAGYSVEQDDIDTSKLNLDVLVELFQECITAHPVRLGLLRYVLRRAAKLGTNRLQDATLSKLSALLPVMRDVCLYLKKAKDKATQTQVAERLIAFGVDSEYAFQPYLQEWIVDVITTAFADSCDDTRLLALARETRTGMGLRGEALIARVRKDISWVRLYKERWRALGPWERRAVIWAGAILADDERHAWKKTVLSTTTDLLDRAVAIRALQ
jgi:hypothetical protein